MSRSAPLVRAAGVVLYRRAPDGRPRFLLLRNRRHGTWAPPKGHLEPGESDLEGARREVLEETGLSIGAVDPSFLEHLRYPVREGGRTALKEVAYFLAEAPSDRVRASAEHDDVGWVTLEEAAPLVRHPDLFDLLARAERAAAT